MAQIIKEVKKRLFLEMLLLGLAFLMLITFGFWYLVFRPQHQLYQTITTIMGSFLFIVIIFLALGIIGTVYAIIKGHTFPFLQNSIRFAVYLLYPMAIYVGKMLDIEKEAVERSFIAVNNQLVKAKVQGVSPQDILILTPHCLQKSDCPHKITINVWNCKQCGRCSINGLLELSRKYGVQVAVVTGGTLARMMIKKMRPKAIVAVACERDLTTGIQDAYPIPVLGVLNMRPEGPCMNTCVDIDLVEEKILELVQPLAAASGKR